MVIGTSSGATAAAQVRSGIPPAELFASVQSPPAQPVGQNRERPPALPMASVFERMRAISASDTSAAELQRAMSEFGLGVRLHTRTHGRTAPRRGRRPVASP